MQLLASEEYGLRCLLQLAAGGGAAPVPIAAIAEAEGIGPEYVAKLLRRLRIAGLVESARGAEGGYRLARPPGEISVWSSVRALGGEFYGAGFCACHPGQRERCVRATDCSLRALWAALQQGVREALEGVTLADLLRDERSMTKWIDPDLTAALDRHPAAP